MGRPFEQLPRPNVAVFGYALFLTISAISLWDGVFPFFPEEFHTTELTMTYSLTKSVAYCATLFASAVAVYFRPQIIREVLVLGGGIPAAVGTCCLIAAMYLPGHTTALAASGGVLLGVGCAGLALAWQRYFSAETPERGTFFLLAGTALAPALFLLLYVVPEAVTVFLTPTILVPLCCLCAILATRQIDFSQSQFSDVPRANPAVYSRLVHDYWRAAVGTGVLGFTSGVVRALALVNPSVGDITNAASLLGSMVVAVVLVAAWQLWSFQFDALSVFKITFPLAFTCLAALPLLPQGLVPFMAGALYMIFSIASLMMLLQCAQASRDRGVNPAFVFGFYGGVVYLLQSIGFICSYYLTGISQGDSTVTLSALSIASLYVLGLALVLQYSGTGAAQRRGLEPARTPARTDRVEFIRVVPTASTSQPRVQAFSEATPPGYADEALPHDDSRRTAEERHEDISAPGSAVLDGAALANAVAEHAPVPGGAGRRMAGPSVEGPAMRSGVAARRPGAFAAADPGDGPTAYDGSSGSDPAAASAATAAEGHVGSAFSAGAAADGGAVAAGAAGAAAAGPHGGPTAASSARGCSDSDVATDVGRHADSTIASSAGRRTDSGSVRLAGSPAKSATIPPETPPPDAPPALQTNARSSGHAATFTTPQPRPASSQPRPASSQDPAHAPKPKARAPRKSASAEYDPTRYRDRISKQCRMMQNRFMLSNRETEVLELVVRGNSVPRIAEVLVISENTVRTHTKHIYTKLDVHKRQQILDLIEEVEQTDWGTFD